ncbi:MAG: hypothetical protein HRU19_13845 [Pseudobacteriovorax sp.]|nr:hypothetical protein [Pseudobacteriovorax sp.]
MASQQSSLNIVDPLYLTCLTHHWNEDLPKLKRQLYSALRTGEQASTDIYLYRLWIDIASHDDTFTDLRALKDHLNTLASDSGGDASLYYSLIAMIHYELGEVEAAELMLSSISRSQRDLYSEELRYYLRLHEEDSPEWDWIYDFASCDYIVVEKLVDSLVVRGRFAEACELSQYAAKYYPQSYIYEKVKLEVVRAVGPFSDVIEIVSSLAEKFPMRHQYQYLKGLSLFRTKRYEEAANCFESAIETAHEPHPEYLTRLGHCQSELYRIGRTEQLYSGALSTLEKAVETAIEQGVSIHEASNQKKRLEKMREDVDVELSERFWLAMMLPQSFASLRTNDLDDIQYIRRPLGNKPQPGDLCFFVYLDKKSSKSDQDWRLAALYKVVEKPEWDPIHRYHSLMSLQFRHEIALPLDMNLIDEGSDRKYSAEDPRKYSVFSMDDSAFDIIVESIRESLGDEDEFAQAILSLRSA